ncbi:hypothetical protein SAMN02799630_03517 [Paenibacillus sp. UNCCL117]|uniref:hypothetical protein n=1 Tax=unclassified Paenibacillus TaxID=185978 RepID=UPI00088CBA0B|nr:MULTISPECIES: hypothetical protein [unclassified Paenibacillus]SDD40830.1 hypothetical protein SAMN04488602_108102 [Paenibacillus sp. cl123]SFW47998.1 hypothetical protein SAMN02799630_03517 [Paenibacillus sp. UNCCL117]
MNENNTMELNELLGEKIAGILLQDMRQASKEDLLAMREAFETLLKYEQSMKLAVS